MEKVLKYRIYCETDAKYEYVLLESTDPAPTTCPTDVAHTIDSDSVTVIEEIGNQDVNIANAVLIAEEDPLYKTGGKFVVEGLDFSLTATPGLQTKDFSFGTNRALLSAHIDIATAWIGDTVTMVIAPDTIVGVVTVAASIGGTVIDVSPTVLEAMKVGYAVKIGDDVCGECTNIDIDNEQITVQTGLVTAAAVNTLIRISVEMARNLRFSTDKVTKDIGDSKIGGSFIPAGTVIRAIYDNVDGVAKEFHFSLEMLY